MSASKPPLQRKIPGIKTSYFPPQSPFIAATNPALLNAGAVSKKATNHFTVGIWFHNVEIERDRGVYEHVCLLRWIFALIIRHWGTALPSVFTQPLWETRGSLFSPSLEAACKHSLKKKKRSTEGRLSLDSYQRRVLGFSKLAGFAKGLTIDKAIPLMCSKNENREMLNKRS